MHKELKRAVEPEQDYRMIRIHPVWYSFIKYCETMKYGEIDKLKIQDGIPLLAEEVKKKIKFMV